MAQFKISTQISLDVGVHFSKYVKINGYGKSISLSRKAWRRIANDRLLIDKSLEDGSECELTFTAAKSFKVSMYRNQRFATFCKQFENNGRKHTMYISLNKTEWCSLKQHIDDIARTLEYDVIACDSHGVWRIHPSAADDSVKNRLVPRMCKETMMLQLCSYLVLEEITKSVKQACYGCSSNSADPYAHSMYGQGCQADWSGIVQIKINDAMKNVNLSNAIDVINKEMNWWVECIPVADNAALFQAVTERGHVKSCCSTCEELLPIYWELYKAILQ